MTRLKSCKAPGCTVRKAREEMFGPMAEWCSTDCAIAVSKLRQKKAAERKRLRESRNLKARKEAIKTQPQWCKEAQKAFNAYIRARDYGKPCISCGCREQERFTGGHFDCGHYRSTGAASHLRFNVFNAHGQCKRCNRELSGNAVEYRIRLVERLGVDLVDRLEQDNRPRTFTIDYLKRVKAMFSRRARHYKKLRGIA